MDSIWPKTEITFKENSNKPLFTEAVDNFVNNMQKVGVEPVIYLPNVKL